MPITITDKLQARAARYVAGASLSNDRLASHLMQEKWAEDGKEPPMCTITVVWSPDQRSVLRDELSISAGQQLFTAASMFPSIHQSRPELQPGAARPVDVENLTVVCLSKDNPTKQLLVVLPVCSVRLWYHNRIFAFQNKVDFERAFVVAASNPEQLLCVFVHGGHGLVGYVLDLLTDWSMFALIFAS